MANNKAAMKNFISQWNATFSDYQLNIKDLKKPVCLMGAVFHVFDRLGINRNAVLKRRSENNMNEHIEYYGDLLPAINMTRVVNHILSKMPQAKPVSVNYFLYPTAKTSRYILMLLLNYMSFQEQQLQSIAPAEDELFNLRDMVHALEGKKEETLKKQNKEAEERGRSLERIEMLRDDCKRLQEIYKHEEFLLEIEKKELQAIIKEGRITDNLIKKKTLHKEALLRDKERLIPKIVKDAEDMREQASQAAKDCAETQDKVNAVTSKFHETQDKLQLVKKMKTKVDEANGIMRTMIQMMEADKRESEEGKEKEERLEKEVEEARSEVAMLEKELEEATERRAAAARNRTAGRDRRRREREQTSRKLREVAERDKKLRESITKNYRRIDEIKARTLVYQQQKAEGFRKIEQIKQDFDDKVEAFDNRLLTLLQNTMEKLNETEADKNVLDSDDDSS